MEYVSLPVVDSVMKCVHYLHMKSVTALDFSSRRQELEMANGAELHTASLQKCSSLLCRANWIWLFNCEHSISRYAAVRLLGAGL